MAGARYDAGLPPFFEGSHWSVAGQPGTREGGAGRLTPIPTYPVDARGLAYSYAFVGIKRLGTGQFYLISIKDKDGQPLRRRQDLSAAPCRPNVPVEQYWSVTAYDRETHALIRNMPRASRSSQIAELQKNADGSVDIYFGPKAPAGKEANWIPTDPDAQVRGDVPPLCADKGAVRQDLDAARHRGHSRSITSRSGRLEALR